MIALLNDEEMGYDDVGKGMPVLFLHGFQLDRSFWEPQIGALVAQCRCISMDMRGSQGSATKGPHTMDQYADDAMALLDSLHIDQAVVVGLSMGGYVALNVWKRHRKRVRAMALADTRATADTEEQQSRRRLLIEAAEKEGSTAVANLQIASLVGKSTREARPDIYDTLHRMLASAPVEGVIGQLQAMMAREDSTPLLEGIDVPVLCVVGDEDVLTTPREMGALCEAIRNSRLEVIERAGHLSSFERSSAVNQVLSEFVGSLLYN